MMNMLLCNSILLHIQTLAISFQGLVGYGRFVGLVLAVGRGEALALFISGIVETAFICCSSI